MADEPLTDDNLEGQAQDLSHRLDELIGETVGELHTIASSGTPIVPELDVREWAAAIAALGIDQALADVVVSAAERAAIGFAFDLDDPLMADAVARHVDALEAWGADLQRAVVPTLEQALAEGWGTEETARRLAADVPLLDRSRALKVARTEVVAAANAGTVEGWRASGLVARKRWLATAGPATRPTHAAADGQEVYLDEPFNIGGHSGAYPGDPALPVGERVHCRCSIVAVHADEPPATGRAAVSASAALHDHERPGPYVTFVAGKPHALSQNHHLLDRVSLRRRGRGNTNGPR